MPTIGPEVVRVAVGILHDRAGRVLVATRDRHRHQGGGLEFPGGKIEPEETAAQALARELKEELDIQVQDAVPLICVRHTYPEREVELAVHTVSRWSGNAVGCEGQDLHWLTPAELDATRFPRANRPIVGLLQYPSLLRVTPVPGHSVDDWGAWLNAQCAPDALLQVRVPGLAATEREKLLAAVPIAASQRPDCQVLLNGTVDEVAHWPLQVGLHLTSRAIQHYDARPVPSGRLLACSAHNADELRHAERIGVDFAVVGPVRATASHPGVGGIGWQCLAELAARTTLPLFAIGGLQPEDLVHARNAGVIGVAGIRGLRTR